MRNPNPQIPHPDGAPGPSWRTMGEKFSSLGFGIWDLGFPADEAQNAEEGR